MSCESCKGHKDPVDRLVSDSQRMEFLEKQKTRRCISICATICIIFAMAVFLISGIEVTTTKEESRIVRETSGEGDAVVQSGENARFYAEGGE